MKKKLFLLCAALLTGLSGWAQTDVTSTYLVNPSFEYSAEGTASTALALNSNSNSTKTYYGWTLPDLGTSYNNTSIGDNSTCNGNKYGIPSAASDGSFYFYNRKGWATATSELSQTTTLPAGKYFISVDYKAYQKGGTTGTLGFSIDDSSIFSSLPYYAISSGSNANTDPWKTVGAWFTISEEKEVKIAITESLVGGSERADLYLDNVRLYKWSTDDETNYAAASEDTPLDMTSKYVTNPYFDSNVDGWTSTTGCSNNKRATNQAGAISGGFYENWNASAKTSGKMSYTATGLPTGKYKVSFATFGDKATTETTGLNVFAGEETNVVPITSSTPTIYSIEATTKTGSLEFGVILGEGNTSLWTGIDNVKLELVKYELDLTEWNNAKAAAQTALDTYSETKYATTERQTVVDAKGIADPTTTSGLATAITTLNDAVAAFTTAYAKDKLQADNAEYVTNYTSIKAKYTESVDASFSTDLSSITGQHWSGESSRTYADTWSGSAYEKYNTATLTLPIGDYVLVAAGRGTVGNTPSISVKVGDADATTYSYPTSGDTGLGIATDGSASYDWRNGTFANNNVGRGWTWGYIEFTLTEESSVTLSYGYKLAADSWASIADCALYTTTETVVAAQKAVYDKALADAQAVTGAMNKDVKDALEAAISATPEATVEGYKAAAETLNTATANANASVEVYKNINSQIEAYATKAAALDTKGAAAYDASSVTSKYSNGNYTSLNEAIIDLMPIYASAFKAQDFVAGMNVTDVIVNPTINQLKAQTDCPSGWTGSTSSWRWTIGTGDTKMECWNGTAAEVSFDMNQTITDLPNGYYVVSAEMHNSTNNETDASFAGGECGIYATSGEANAFQGVMVDNDNLRRYGCLIDVENNTLTIGVKNASTPTARWFSADNFTLTYVGSSFYDISDGTYTLQSGENFLNSATNSAETDEISLSSDGVIYDATISNKEITFTRNGIADANILFVSSSLDLKDGKSQVYDNGTNAGNKIDTKWVAIPVTNGFALLNTGTGKTLVNVNGIVRAEITPVTNGIAWTLNDVSLKVAKDALKAAIDAAPAVPTEHVSENGVFEYNKTQCDNISSTLSTAQEVYENTTATKDEVDAQTTAVKALTAPSLNAPSATQAYKIILKYNGWAYNNCAMTARANERTDMGNYNIQYNAQNDNYAQAMYFTQVEGGYNISWIDADGNTRYLCTGTPYSGNNYQIRSTTTASDAMIIKVSRNGDYINLYNVAASQYIGSQDAGVYTVNSHIDFTIAETTAKHDITYTVAAGYGTICLPYNATTTVGKAYTISGVESDNATLTLESVETLEANKAYVLEGNGTYEFLGVNVAFAAPAANGLLTGVYTQTSPAAGTYVLQKQNGVVGFYQVAESYEEGQAPVVKANRAYLTAPAGTSIKAFYFDQADAIQAIEALTSGDAKIYDLNGRQLSKLQKGINIVNGKKIMVK